VEHRRIIVSAHRLTHTVLLLANAVRKFRLTNLLATDSCHLGNAAAASKVVIDAKEGEGKRDQREDDLYDALPAVDEIEHDMACLPGGCRSSPSTSRWMVGNVQKGRTRVRPNILFYPKRGARVSPEAQ